MQLLRAVNKSVSFLKCKYQQPSSISIGIERCKHFETDILIIERSVEEQPSEKNKSLQKLYTKRKEMTSQVRQNYHQDCEDAINKQINMELFASYTYMSMAFYFDRDDVALSGMHKYFSKASHEEREHAMKFMKYQNKRGGRVVLSDVKAPKTEWGTAQDAMQAALDLEADVNESLLKIHRIATEKNDVNLCDFLEGEYLQEQVDSMKEIADYVTNLKRVGEGLGVHMFDRQLYEENSN